MHAFGTGWGSARAALLRRLVLTALAVLVGFPTVTPAPLTTANAKHGHGRATLDVAVEKKQKNRGKTFKTVPRSFANDGFIALPETSAANPYPATINVAGFRGTPRIADVNLTLSGFSHDEPSDIDVLLVAPSGRQALVMAGVGNPDENDDVVFITLTLDDEAAAPLPENERLESGTFRPFDSGDPGPLGLIDFPDPAPDLSGDVALATFDGGNPNGQWQLFVINDDPGDLGEFATGWTLEIAAKVKKKRR